MTSHGVTPTSPSRAGETSCAPAHGAARTGDGPLGEPSGWVLLCERVALANIFLFPVVYFTVSLVLGSNPYPLRADASNFRPDGPPVLFRDSLPFLASNALLLILWVCRTRIRPGLRDRDALWDVLLILCGAWMALASAVHDDPLWGPFLAWGSGFFLAVYARRNFGHSYGHRFLLVVAALALLSQLVLCSLQFFALSGTGTSHAMLVRALKVRTEMMGGGGTNLPRAVGAIGGANSLSAWIVMLCPLVFLGGQAVRRAGHRVLATACVCGSLLCLAIPIRNVARWAMVVGVLGLGSAVFIDRVRFRRREPGRALPRLPRRSGFALAILPAVLLAGAGYLASGSPGGHSFARIVAAKAAETGTAGRVRYGVMQAATRAVAERPLLGSGFGRGCRAMPELEAITLQAGGRYWHVKGLHSAAHNVFLMVAMDGGLPAVSLLLAALGWTVARTWSRRRHLGEADAGVALSVAVYLALSLTYNAAYEPTAHLWPTFLFLLGCLQAISARRLPD